MAITARGKYKGRKKNPPNPDGRTPLHGVKKKSRSLTLTDDAWLNVKAIAKENGLSASELLEQIGRGEFVLQKAS